MRARVRPEVFPPAENAVTLFTALDAEVHASWLRRALWKAAAFVGVLGGFLLIGPTLIPAIIAWLLSGAH